MSICTKKYQWVSMLHLVNGSLMGGCFHDPGVSRDSATGLSAGYGTTDDSNTGTSTTGEGSTSGTTDGNVNSSTNSSGDAGSDETMGDGPPVLGCNPLPKKVELGNIANGQGGFAIIDDDNLPEDKMCDGDQWWCQYGFGGTVNHLGDVNGDGLDDFAVAESSNFDGETPDINGHVYVVFGKKSVTSVKTSDLSNGVGGYMIGGQVGNFPNFENIDVTVSDAGDINGDGLDDIVVSSLDYDSGFSMHYVVFGKNNTQHVLFDDIADGIGGFLVVLEKYESLKNSVVAGGGDVNNDGLDDIVLSASGNEMPTAFVVFGKVGNEKVVLEGAEISASDGYPIGSEQSALPVDSLDIVGDINGDGVDDMAIAVPTDSSPLYSSRVFIVFGKKDPQPVYLNHLMQGMGGFVIHGETSNKKVPNDVTIQVRQAGDINGDGLADLVIGNAYAQAQDMPQGKTYVVLGKADTQQVKLSDIAQGIGGFAIDGGGPLDYFGSAVGGGGDYNGDGYDDIIIGAWHWEYNVLSQHNETGKTYIVYGNSGAEGPSHADIMNGVGGFTLMGVWQQGRAGYSLDVAGDVNGDGFADWLIGAPGPKVEDGDVGQVEQSYVVFGGCK